MHKSPNKVFKNLGSPRTGIDLRPQVTSLSTRQTDQKTILPQQGLLNPRLNNYLERWKEITLDPEIFHVVSGYQIPFHSVPLQLHVPVTKCSDLTVPLVDAEVNKLLSKKMEGTYRPVIDLSRLNRFVENFYFQMENISCLKTLLRKGGFMTCIDLKDISLSTNTSPHESTCVSNVESDVMPSRVITKLIKPIVAYLRKRGIRIIVYLDNFLIH